MNAANLKAVRRMMACADEARRLSRSLHVLKGQCAAPGMRGCSLKLRSRDERANQAHRS